MTGGSETGHVQQVLPEAPAKKRGCGFWVLVGVGAFVGIGVIGNLLDGGKRPVSASAPAPAPASDSAPAATPGDAPATKASARELFAAYEANQLAAAKLYADRALEVSGTVQAIDESLGKPVVQLETSNQFMPLQARFPVSATDQLTGLAKGDKVTVQCAKLEEAGGFLWLNDCALAEDAK